MDEAVDALPVDVTRGPTRNASFHTDAYQLTNNEGAPDTFVVAQACEQPEPVPVCAEQHRGVENGTRARRRRRRLIHARFCRPSATSRAASSSDTSSRS